jgi:hypothetical protein
MVEIDATARGRDEPTARAYPAGVWVYLSSEAVMNLRIFPVGGRKSTHWLELAGLSDCIDKPVYKSVTR